MLSHACLEDGGVVENWRVAEGCGEMWRVASVGRGCRGVRRVGERTGEVWSVAEGGNCWLARTWHMPGAFGIQIHVSQCFTLVIPGLGCPFHARLEEVVARECNDNTNLSWNHCLLSWLLK